MSPRKSVLIPRQVKDLGFKPVFVSCGASHSLMLSTDGEVWGLGSSMQGELGTKDNFFFPKKVELPNKITAVACGEHHSIVRDEDGQLFGSGRNEHGQLGMLGNCVEQFSPILLPSYTINVISCGPTSSVFLDCSN